MLRALPTVHKGKSIEALRIHLSRRWYGELKCFFNGNCDSTPIMFMRNRSFLHTLHDCRVASVMRAWCLLCSRLLYGRLATCIGSSFRSSVIIWVVLLAHVYNTFRISSVAVLLYHTMVRVIRLLGMMLLLNPLSTTNTSWFIAAPCVASYGKASVCSIREPCLSYLPAKSLALWIHVLGWYTAISQMTITVEGYPKTLLNISRQIPQLVVRQELYCQFSQ